MRKEQIGNKGSSNWVIVDRVMSELPSSMQEGIAHLELEAREVPKDRMDSISSISSVQGQYRDPVSPMQPTSPQSRQPQGQMQPMSPQSQQPQGFASNGYTAEYDHTNAARYQNVFTHAQGRNEQFGNTRAPDKSLPSPFPKLRDAGPNVPPSVEEQGAMLNRTRQIVLQSKDAEMQLAWAQDALLWVDNAMQSRLRLSEGQSGTSPVEQELRTDAVNIVIFLAEQLHPKALFMRAVWYEFGKFDYPLDSKEAVLGYGRAAERGYGRAEYRLGTQYEAMNDMAKAKKHYTIGVSVGDSASNYRLGMMSLLGQHGQPQDCQLGIKRIKFAAETADENAPQGAYVYGMLLARELPNITIPETVLPIDIDQARHFIEKAAFLGFAKAQLKMGSAYELCLLGCEFNPALSLHYNALAAHQGEADADMAISKWFLCGFEGVFDKNEELAFTYAKCAAQADLPTAEFALGYFYEIGMYVQSDLRQAKSWYQKAADHGNKDAVGRLESLSQQKTLSKKDHEQIAINRIKSQYGSRKGQRPERLREKPTPLPPMEEERVDMPEPTSTHSRASSSNPFMIVTGDNYPPARPTSTAPPPRPMSAAPYPEDPPRSKSTAPYPEDDVTSSGYGMRPVISQLHPQQRPLQGPPADRPSSAFGIRPANSQPYNQNGPALRQDAALRPAISMVNMSQAVLEGRGSNPAARNRVVSAGWEPQPLPGPVPAGNYGRQPSYDNSHIGRNRLQKPNPNSSRPPAPQQILTPDPGYPVTPIMPNSTFRTSQVPQPGSQTRRESLNNIPGASARPASIDHRASLPSNNIQRLDRFDSMPQNAGRNPQRPYLPASSAPPRASSVTPSSISSLPSRTSSVTPVTSPVTSSQPSKPIKQGPQTFDEMGIPAGKTDGDCVSLKFPPSICPIFI